ncbi:MAG TPA: hypothetical protein VGP46_02370, partial [Acidimicrobiales bacterium]|nr:hypothetical protein [Acidimicrobiales bacterium]
PAVELVAAALRADTADLDAYHKVLSNTIGSMLPADMVEVDRERSLSDRVAGRAGTATAIRLHLGDKTLELTARKGRLVATSAQVVRGVAISNKEVSVADWVKQLAEYVSAVASENADARQALSRLIGP